MQSDESLMRRIQARDPGAFDALFARYADRVHRRIDAIVRSTASSDDLTQEVFLRAHKKLGQLRDPQSFAAWLIGIARQVCREWRRGRLRERHLRVAMPADVTSSAEGDQPDERIREVRSAIASLPEKERLALHSFYLQELGTEQARLVLGLSRSGFYRVLACARQRLARVLGRQEVRR